MDHLLYPDQGDVFNGDTFVSNSVFGQLRNL